ncbi:hypothetical protein OGATHE_004614 [Ogataea polymorpha]|uniref:Uncharacterized protein n=1 Tax=Ogataea polymorpha TaxID=460523 RepID=A0A9P8NZF3_9ASCO|nr:hypothetical protein OGATHE_004614 [Ogataea polymorpha]
MKSAKSPFGSIELSKVSSQNPNLVLLTNTVSPILGLKVLMRIPVCVKDNNRVGSLQVQSQTTRSSRKKENKIWRILRVEILQQCSTVISSSVSIQPHVMHSSESEEVLHDVHNLSHLEKHQHSVTAGTEFGQNPVQKFKLSAHPPNCIVVFMRRIYHVFNCREHIWMITDFSQLHEFVVHTLDSNGGLAVRVTNKQLIVLQHLMIQFGL